jgi:hypothetical protein
MAKTFGYRHQYDRIKRSYFRCLDLIILLTWLLALFCPAASPVHAQTPEKSGKSASKDKGFQLNATQKARIQDLLKGADELDQIYRKGSPGRVDLKAYDRVLQHMARQYLDVSPSLPRNDAPMMLCNMMDGYVQLGSGLFQIRGYVPPAELEARMAAAILRKQLLRNILAGKVTSAQFEILKTLRKQGQEGC